MARRLLIGGGHVYSDSKNAQGSGKKFRGEIGIHMYLQKDTVSLLKIIGKTGLGLDFALSKLRARI